MNNEVIKQIQARKSVRVFENKEIDRNVKDLILDAALQAPTAGNQIMYTIIEVEDKEILKALSKSCDNQPFIADAKMALVFCADFQKWYDAFKIVEENPRKPMVGDLMLAVNDALIAAQNTVMAAESMGVGSCYIGDMMEQYEVHKELLHLPQYTFPVTLLVFGYPTEQQKNRKKPARFDKKYIVHKDTYQKMNDETLQAMFVDRAEKEGMNPFLFEKWLLAFYHRKYNSDFSREMSRSVQKYIDDFSK